jgi:hypothetical protein
MYLLYDETSPTLAKRINVERVLRVNVPEELWKPGYLDAPFIIAVSVVALHSSKAQSFTSYMQLLE